MCKFMSLCIESADCIPARCSASYRGRRSIKNDKRVSSLSLFSITIPSPFGDLALLLTLPHPMPPASPGNGLAAQICNKTNPATSSRRPQSTHPVRSLRLKSTMHMVLHINRRAAICVLVRLAKEIIASHRDATQRNASPRLAATPQRPSQKPSADHQTLPAKKGQTHILHAALDNKNTWR
ncbi:hypothetical protein VTL71DRAFT_8367 [Oculimacula yallundae]|uniref:Uncharacterized protein n=1 Tax=Oculimacula yallundae TaxID=86028 RepID=A0ABR4CXE8_9HELO